MITSNFILLISLLLLTIGAFLFTSFKSKEVIKIHSMFRLALKRFYLISTVCILPLIISFFTKSVEISYIITGIASLTLSYFLFFRDKKRYFLLLLTLIAMISLLFLWKYDPKLGYVQVYIMIFIEMAFWMFGCLIVVGAIFKNIDSPNDYKTPYKMFFDKSSDKTNS